MDEEVLVAAAALNMLLKRQQNVLTVLFCARVHVARKGGMLGGYTRHVHIVEKGRQF
jgi:hypothetical protein